MNKNQDFQLFFDTIPSLDMVLSILQKLQYLRTSITATDSFKKVRVLRDIASQTPLEKSHRQHQL